MEENGKGSGKSMTEQVLLRKESGLYILTLNRPEAANSLNSSLVSELLSLLGDIKHDREAKVMILTGAGSRAFCAGADLKERKEMAEWEVPKAVEAIGGVMNAVADLPQPVIAAMNGGAFGGGLELALACDFRIAADTAKMGLTETALGIIPGAGGTQRLPRIIGVTAAKELIYTAKKITAEEAVRIGLVSKAVEAQNVIREARILAQEIMENAPIALAQAKRAIDTGMETDLHSGIIIESLCYAKTIQTKDRLEGLKAFTEKRKPVYRGE